MNANNLESLKFASTAASTSNAASGSATLAAAAASNMTTNANRNIRDIPEEHDITNCDLPPTIKLLVYLWDEIKSYCIQVGFFLLIFCDLFLYFAYFSGFHFTLKLGLQ